MIMGGSHRGGFVVRLAAIFPPTQPPERIVAVAAAADAAGLADLWVREDCFNLDSVALDWPPAVVVVFISAPADSPAPDIAAVVRGYAAAGASCVAVNAGEDDADIERFAGFLAREVSPLVSADG
jgi:hypothetical protein